MRRLIFYFKIYFLNACQVISSDVKNKIIAYCAEIDI